MPDITSESSHRTAGGCWWRERELFLLAAFAIAAHFPRAGELPLRGEESTRAQMAFEMVARKDFLVPRAQGEPFLIRPPLQMWAIAATAFALGNWSEWTIRLHSLLATLGATLLVYGYSRTFLGRLGSLASGLAFASFGDWFQMGRQAETEAIFTFLLGGALLLWHWGVVRGWPSPLVFSTGYGLMALAMLAKGLQAPAYFVGATWAHMILARDWKRMFSTGHLAGMAVGAVLLGAWMLPHSLEMGWEGTLMAFTGDPAYQVNGRVHQWKAGEFARHLLTLPAEVAVGALPWSPLLLALMAPGFRSHWGSRSTQVGYLWTCVAVAFPTIWLPPGGLPRYFAPLLPCVAVLSGAAMEWLATPGAAVPRRRLQGAAVALMAGMGLVAGASPWLAGIPKWAAFAEPVPAALAYAVVFLALATATALQMGKDGARSTWTCAVSMALAMAVYFSGFVMDYRMRRSTDPAGAMRAIKEAIPPGKLLVSFGDHYLAPLFAFHHGKPFISRLPWPAHESDVPPGVDYFCFEVHGSATPALPFPWAEVGVFPLDRYLLPVPVSRVVVGRRVPPHHGVAPQGP